MSDRVSIRRALLSVYDKSGLVELGQAAWQPDGCESRLRTLQHERLGAGLCDVREVVGGPGDAGEACGAAGPSRRAVVQ